MFEVGFSNVGASGCQTAACRARQALEGVTVVVGRLQVVAVDVVEFMLRVSIHFDVASLATRNILFIKVNVDESPRLFRPYPKLKDIIHPVLYLLNGKADTINGVTQYIDGGTSFSNSVAGVIVPTKLDDLKSDMNIRFDGKRALVTGAGKGIGKGIAEALFAGGAETYALSRTQEDLDKLEDENPGMNTVCVDLSDWATTKKAVEQIGPIDLLVNNAGILISSPFLKTAENDVNKTFDVNVKAVVNVSQVVAKCMVERGNGGAIVHISTVVSDRAAENLASYCASKGALDQIMRVMALELGPHQIRVNCVLPTAVMTAKGIPYWTDPVKTAADISKIPQRRFPDVKDIVHPVLYLLSDKADMINGVTLKVDGGTSVS